jgi:hypothetical protein
MKFKKKGKVIVSIKRHFFHIFFFFKKCINLVIMKTHHQIITLYLNCWLLLTLPIMESLAFSSKGTMTQDSVVEPDIKSDIASDIEPKQPRSLRRKVLVKKILTDLTPPDDFVPMMNEIPDSGYQAPDTGYHAPDTSYHSPDTQYSSYHYPNYHSPMKNDTLPQYHHKHHHQHQHHEHKPEITTTTIKPLPRVKRVFGNFFHGATAVVESAIKIGIPIPFCQFPNAPCKNQIISLIFYRLLMLHVFSINCRV